MGKNYKTLFIIVLILGFFLVNPLHSAQAIPNNSVPIANGDWNVGTEINVDLTTTSAPSWLQLLSTGVKVTEATKLCHPLRGGQYGWVGEIRQLVKGNWVKLETINDWVPSKEGEFMACAQAPSAGTYALFGYYVRPEGFAESSSPACNIDMSGWKFYAYYAGHNTYDLYGYVPGVEIGSNVSYSVVNGSVIGTLFQPGDTAGNGSVFADITDIDMGITVNSQLSGHFYNTVVEGYSPPDGSVILSSSGCQIEVPFTVTNPT